MSTLPKIGEIVMSPHEKYKENGVAKFDQLDLTEGLTVNQAAHPELFAIHPSSEVLEEGLDSLASPNPSTPYRIVADLTEEV